MIRISRILLLATLVFTACSTEDEGGNGGGNETDSFDRGAMLTHWADNFIAPAFVDFNAQTRQLEDLAISFGETPSVENLEALRNQYIEAYKDFQSVSMFQVGKAEELNYRSFLNTYPANVEEIESKIASGTYNLELPSSYSEQGFPALDYLLYGFGTAEETLETLTSNEDYINYLVEVTARINALTTQVTASWEGNYRDTFVNNTSSSSTGSVDRFTNDYVMYFEKILRSGKIGYPAGAFTGTPSPKNVEAFYADNLSKELYEAAVQRFYDFYLGTSDFGNGPSYSQYLTYLDSMKDGEGLDELIKAQFSDIFSKSDNLNNSLKTQIETDNTQMLTTFDELQKAVILLKVDMMQALSISVDYVDSDGD